MKTKKATHTTNKKTFSISCEKSVEWKGEHTHTHTHAHTSVCIRNEMIIVPFFGSMNEPSRDKKNRLKREKIQNVFKWFYLIRKREVRVCVRVRFVFISKLWFSSLTLLLPPHSSLIKAHIYRRVTSECSSVRLNHHSYRWRDRSTDRIVSWFNMRRPTPVSFPEWTTIIWDEFKAVGALNLNIPIKHRFGSNFCKSILIATKKNVNEPIFLRHFRSKTRRNFARLHCKQEMNAYFFLASPVAQATRYIHTSYEFVMTWRWENFDERFCTPWPKDAAVHSVFIHLLLLKYVMCRISTETNQQANKQARQIEIWTKIGVFLLWIHIYMWSTEHKAVSECIESNSLAFSM